jgi:dienelactone hydrolase
VDYFPPRVCAARADTGKTGTPPAFARDVAPMTRRATKVLCALALMAASGCATARAQNSIGPQGPEEGVIRRQSWLIPAQDRATMMKTTVFRPPGAGPFPLAVINHGSTQNELLRAQYPLPEYRILTEWLVKHGYAVAVPQRPGHGATGGRYLEDQGSCADADFRKSGLNTAASIAAVIDTMSYQPFIRKTDAIAIGQSAGGWGALALATQYMKPLKAVVAFAPGRGGHINGVAGNNCAPGRLVEAAHSFGEKARVPTLWFYAENDSYFPPRLSKRLVEAFRLAGGRAEFHLLPPVGRDGHTMINSAEAAALWEPMLEKFLKGLRK